MKIEWDNVTWYSKIAALIFFISLPFIAFYLGVQYQKIALISAPKESLPIASTTSALFDKSKWELIKYQKVDFIKWSGFPDGVPTREHEKARDVDIYLLRSVAQTASTGAEAPLYDMNFIVARGAKILYQFTSKVPGTNGDGSYSKNEGVYYDDDNIEIKDVTNDRPPLTTSLYQEIIFSAAGPMGASTSLSYIHILQYQPDADSFKDIAIDDFRKTEVSGFAWFNLDIKTLALVATPDPAELRQCHFCDSSYLYKIYQWDDSKNSFLLNRILTSQKKYSFATFPEMILEVTQQMVVK